MQVFWDLKYKPTLDTFIYNNATTKNYFQNLTEVPNLLLSGPPGTGKTTLSKLLIEKFANAMDVLIINASDENGVDTIRDKIKTFISTNSFSAHKVVLLDECDYLSDNAQGILRALILDNIEHARFILTCNYLDKVIPELQSRCDYFEFDFYDPLDIAEYIGKILINEKIKFSFDDVEYYINRYYPDFRKIIKSIQQNCIDFKLEKSIQNFGFVNYINNKDWIGLRTYLANNPNIREYDYYTELFDHLDTIDSFKNNEKYCQAIITIANWQNAKGPNRLINMVACAIELIGVM